MDMALGSVLALIILPIDIILDILKKLMKPNSFGGITFNCGERYKLLKLVGTGAYGAVVLAYDL